MSTRDPRAFFLEAAAYFRPRSSLTPSEWAERDRYVSDGDHAGSPWSWELTPYLREICDYAAAPTHREAVVLKSARVGYTHGVLLNIAGWTACEDPAPVMVMMPTDELAQRFGLKHLDGAIDATPALREIMKANPDKTGGRHQKGQAKTLRLYPGGSLEIKSAGVDGNFRSFPFRRVLADEIDDWKDTPAAKVEGSPIKRLVGRTMDYHDGFVIAGSSPRITETSRVWEMWQESDQRKWFMPCPLCGHRQCYIWERVEWPKRVKCCGKPARYGEPCEECGELDAPGRRTKHLTKLAFYRCEGCDGEIRASQKHAMVSAGEWRPTKEGGGPGWHVHTVMSLINTAEWSVLAEEYIKAKRAMQAGNDQLLRVFRNLWLGLPWTETMEEGVADVRERAVASWGKARDGSKLEVPEGFGVLTAGVDLNTSRGGWLEVLVRGWGEGGQSCDVLHHRIKGNLSYPNPVWDELTEIVMRKYQAVGRKLSIDRVFVDSGHMAEEVYQFCRQFTGGVFPAKGRQQGLVAEFSRKQGREHGLVMIGTHAAKNQLFARLAVDVPGPNYMWMRLEDREMCNGFDPEYHSQFRAERMMLKGQRKAWYVIGNRRNEAIDLHVLAAAAFASLDVVDRTLRSRAELAAKAPKDEVGAGVARRKRGTVHPGYGKGGDRIPRGWT